ncbi:MAG TPA: hypothetical protein PKE06_13995 [Flavilitoribacter sp.]|nr:hypothetical protein [Flavilitoribacter sp.]HMQ86635.1 hypothetical protein [Flavilitoribacter sp.]
MKNKSLSFPVLIAFAGLALAVTGCQVGVNKDLTTGLSYSYKGLGAEEVFLSKDNQLFKSSDFPMGSQVVMHFSGVNGFKAVEGKVYPGLSIRVTDGSGAAVIDAPDLFTQYDAEGLDPEIAAELSGNITIGDPMVSGGEYLWEVKVWDKKGDGTINASMNFTAVE